MNVKAIVIGLAAFILGLLVASRPIAADANGYTITRTAATAGSAKVQGNVVGFSCLTESIDSGHGVFCYTLSKP